MRLVKTSERLPENPGVYWVQVTEDDSKEKDALMWNGLAWCYYEHHADHLWYEQFYRIPYAWVEE